MEDYGTQQWWADYEDHWDEVDSMQQSLEKNNE